MLKKYSRKNLILGSSLLPLAAHLIIYLLYNCDGV